jgi:lysophospholipase L1-like esterase
VPRRSVVPVIASLAVTVTCVILVVGCTSTAVSSGRSQPAGTGQPSVVGQPTVASRPAVASGPARTGQPAVASGPASTGRPTGEQYYLALGDSLAAGYQPNQDADQGYTNQLDAQLRSHGSVLTLDNLACSGETTQTMIQGGVCSYPDGPDQLQAALDFLHAHQGHVPLITIDIGGNDMDSCNSLTSVSSADACTESAIPAMSKNLTAVLKALDAADPSAVITGLNYYVPELAGWLDGSSGPAFAAAQLSATKVLNAALAADYAAAGARYADVFTEFKSDDLTGMTTVSGYGSVPVDVAMVCEWTWMCSAEDEHANAAGYGAIAAAIYAVLPASIAE